jgi:hypothetical protein
LKVSLQYREDRLTKFFRCFGTCYFVIDPDNRTLSVAPDELSLMTPVDKFNQVGAALVLVFVD